MPPRLAHLPQLPIRMHRSLKPNLDPRNPRHSIQHRRMQPHNRLPIQRRSRPIITAPNSALHTSLGGSYNEADGRTCGLDKRHGHGTCVDDCEDLDEVRYGKGLGDLEDYGIEV